MVRPGGFSNTNLLRSSIKKGVATLSTPPFMTYTLFILVVGEMVGSEVLETDTFKGHHNFPLINIYKESQLPTMTQFHNRSMANNTCLDNIPVVH